MVVPMACGYATSVKVFLGPGLEAPGWVTSGGVPFENVAKAEDLDSAYECQAHCAGAHNATYFAHDAADSLCVCKAAYQDMICEPTYEPHHDPGMVSGPVVCEECFKGPGIDVAGAFNPCGFAPVLKVFAKPGYSWPSWVTDQNTPHELVKTAEELDSPAECQEHCLLAEAMYSSFEPAEMCVCKDQYPGANASCVPMYGADPGGNYPTIISGPTMCSSCFQYEMDMGGGVKDCGYAPEVIAFAGPNYSFPSWVSNKGIPTENVAMAADLASPADCQEHCLREGAHYFAFEEGEMCVCNNSYGNSSCSPIYHHKAKTTSGPTKCVECLMDGHGVAGSENDCGFAKEVVVFGGPLFDMDSHSWITSKKIPVEMEPRIAGPLHCQDLCGHYEAKPKAAFFVYDATKTRCICKAAYGHPMCSPQYQHDVDSVSGPVKCYGEMMACGDLRGFYRESSCCGMPNKLVPMMKA